MADDSGEVQTLQITEDCSGDAASSRVADKVRRIADFGFSSVPPLGSEVIVWRRLAQRVLALAMGVNHRASRPTGMQPGDTVLYDVRGAKVQLTKDGLLIDCAGLPATVQNASTIMLKATQKVTIDAPDAEFTGTLHATGTISTDADMTFAGNSLANLRTAYDGHKHGGVKAGTDTSGGPNVSA